MNKLSFFEYYYYLKPNFLPLYLREISGYFYHPEANVSEVKDKTSCCSYFTESFKKNRAGTTWAISPAHFAYSRIPEFEVSCFSCLWCNMQFVLTCFGLKWLLYVLYIRTIMHPRYVYEWLILPAAWLRFALNESKPDKALLYKSVYTQVEDTPKTGKVSVVIPTKNRYTLLNNLLRHLNEQTHLPEEVIIVDQSEPSQPVLFESKIPVVYISYKQGGHSSARNHGISQARGEYILSLDDDSEIGPHLISCHLKTFEKFPDSDASVGPYYTPLEKKIEPVETWSFSPHLPACNSMIKKSFFIKTDGFTTTTDNHYLSDPDIYIRAIQRKGKIIMNHQACICHLEPVGGGLKLSRTNTFKHGGLFYDPAEKEIKFYSKVFGENMMNKWYFYQCQKFLSKKMARHKLGMFRGIVLLFACPIWQTYYFFHIRKKIRAYAG